MAKTNEKVQSPSQIHYPPVVAVLGHVDHGKTTLLDAIRKTDIARIEHGGITQRIGASKIDFLHEGIKRQITFIDTPGHEAFSKMRGRGLQAADIGLLAVSSTDGVMPQTKESINLLKESKIPFIVVLTKSDLADKNPEKVKGQLLKEGVILEESGGDIPMIEVSAKTNSNIKELLELILLVFEMKGLAPSSDNEFKAVVIESKLDPKKGPLASIVVKSGILKLKDQLFSEDREASRVRSITNDKGERLKEAFTGDAVEILGFVKIPPVGSIVVKSPSVKTNDKKQAILPSEPESSPQTNLSVILCADTLGSLEAIVNALPKEINVVSQKTGDIASSDIFFAKSTKAIILGFNIKINPEVSRLASAEKVLVKNYSLIYELIDEITDVLKGKELELEEKILGTAKVLASFPFEKTKVLGVIVLSGRIARGDKVRLERNGEAVGESKIISLRSGKDPVSKAEKGEQAGAIISPFLDFAIEDMLICR